MVSVEHEQDGFRYGPDDITFQERFTLRPVPPAQITEAAEDGRTLRTMDVPEYTGRSLAPTVDTGTALYRLVQLFGTPNVPGLEAGAAQPPRELTTWQYLFSVVYSPPDGEEEPPVPAPANETELLLSAYDHKTNLSVGLSGWERSGADRVAEEPGREPLSGVDLPEEEFLVVLVQLVLSSVEHPVEATYQELWV